MSFDPSIWQQARDRMPLPRLMQHMGDGEHSNKTAHCPFCQEKQKRFGIYKAKNSGQWQFKCHNPECVANDPELGRSEIGYIALRRNLSQKDASLEFLKLAVPEVLEAQQRERKKKKDPKPESPSADSASAGGDQSEPPPTPAPPENVVAFSTPPPPDPQNPYDALWRKLVLTPHDRTKLHGRGFSDTLIDTLGFKSNNQSNRVHVESLKTEFAMELLLETGIFKQFKSDTRPNPQLLGWGLKRKARKEGDDDQWDWTEPILIPYLKDDGVCFYLRPHKGGIIGSDSDDEDEDEPSCSSHVYCPLLLANTAATVEGTVILTEGEFKAAALFQCGIPAIAIPGVTFVRNPIFRAELLSQIKQFAVTDLVIAFDNEVKDDPAFSARYKPDPADRYDTAMWAEYIAIDLGREHFGPHKGQIRIGVLPDNLREDGKVDFDSALSYFVRQKRDGARGTEAARKIFQKVIDDARPQRRARDLFPTESRRIIEHKLNKLFYRPLVSAGGDKALRFANQCQANGEIEVAKAYRSVIGCYYERQGVKEADRKLAIEKASAAARAIEQAKAAGINGSDIRALKVKARAAWEHVYGLPVPVSDFTLAGHFKLYNPEGKADRLITIRNHNDKGKSDGKLYRIGPDQLGRGPEFVCFMLATGKGVWKGGARLLSHLQEDIDHQTYMRDIYVINFYGYHAASGMWFFGDCAFGPNGDLIEADKYNIFWNAGIGYQVDSSVEERGTSFEQGAPLMLSPHGGKPVDRDFGDLFHDLCMDLFYTIGGYEAWLMLGLVFAYAASPELLLLGGHPSPWLFGKMSGGKTTIARWIMRVWGFKHLDGVSIDDRTTPVGMNRFLAQYSCLPVWFDEYRPNHNDAQKESVLRGAFDRNSGAKGLADHSNRTRSAKIHTSPVVTGEGSSSDAATRSRYGHINVSERRRIGDGAARYAKVQNEAKHYYVVGRFIMENRPKFIKHMLELCDNWMSDPKIRSRIVNERVRFVYATAWSAFMALSRMIAGSGAEERAGMEPEFKDEMIKHAEQALQDVFSETFLTRFWIDVISGLSRNKIKSRFFDVRHVHQADDGTLKEAEAADKIAMTVCYIAPKPLFDEYAQDLRTRGESPPLDLGDLRREIAKEPYWVATPSKEPRVHRVQIYGSIQTCWVINLGQDATGKYIFPFGEDLEQVLHPNQAERPEGDEKANRDLAAESTKKGH